jgi:hypothetical protein
MGRIACGNFNKGYTQIAARFAHVLYGLSEATVVAESKKIIHGEGPVNNPG